MQAMTNRNNVICLLIVVLRLVERNATNAERIKKIDIADRLCKQLEREPQEVKAAITDQERILDEMVKANSAVGLLVEVLDLKIVEDAEVIPDSAFYFARNGRKANKKDSWVQRHHLYN